MGEENASQISSRAGFDPQAERKRLRETIFRLSKEIDYKNYKHLELECKYNDTAILFRKVATRLTEIINSRDRSVSELEHKLRESSEVIQRLTSENDRLEKQCSREMSARQLITSNLESDLERQKFRYEKLARELKESIARRDSLQRDLEDEIIKLKDQNEIESNSYSEAQIDVLRKEINEKEDTIWDLQALNTTLAARDFESNKEVNDCRKVLLDGLQDILTRRTKLVIKRMGELDEIPFLQLCYERFPEQDWEGMAAKICSFWQEKIIDPHWHPFKIVDSDGVTEEIVNEEDEKLRLAREELGESGYKAVRNALLEMNEYNPSGRYSVPEIRVEKEARKASLTEAIRYILQQLKAKKKRMRL